jgi:hypothetical protein
VVGGVPCVWFGLFPFRVAGDGSETCLLELVRKIFVDCAGRRVSECTLADFDVRHGVHADGRVGVGRSHRMWALEFELGAGVESRRLAAEGAWLESLRVAESFALLEVDVVRRLVFDDNLRLRGDLIGIIELGLDLLQNFLLVLRAHFIIDL